MSRRRGKKKIPEGLINAEIESFCHDGRGLTHIDGQVVFVDGGLPGEQVALEYTDMRRDFAEAKVVQVLQASPLRTEPKCEYFGLCGGCSFQHVDPAQQILLKQGLLDEQFRRIGQLENLTFWAPLIGPLWGYRYKARLGVKYVVKKNRVLVGFREKGNRFLADMDRCEVLHPQVGDKLSELAEMIHRLSIRHRIPQIEVSIGDAECVLVFRNLDEATIEDLAFLREFGQLHDFQIYLQPKGPDSLLPVDDFKSKTLRYTLPSHGLNFYFEPLHFTQVNVDINRRMVDWAIELLNPEPEDRAIDLFCGIGNFTLPIARYVDQVVGIEGSVGLIEQARKNALCNQLDNVEFHVADLARDVTGEQWCNMTYTLALLDPSRVGAEEILQYFPRWGVRRIVYISCNTSTLARDAGILVHQFGYRLSGAAVMDMFPQTSHVESIALFEKN